MATTIASGTSPNITLPAGQRLMFYPGGAGIGVVLIGSRPGSPHTLGIGPATIGPFGVDRVVSVSCERALTYDFSTPNAGITPVRADPATGNVYANGLSVVSGAENSIVPLKPHGSFEGSSGVLTYTLHLTLTSPVPFYGLRLRLYNPNSSDCVGVLAGVATSSNMTGGVQAPTGTPVQATVNAATAITVPQATSGGGQPGDDAILGEVITDWINVASVARDDGGTGYLLMVRIYYPSAGNTSAMRSTNLGLSAADVATWGCAAVGMVGDRVTTWGSWATSVSSIGPCFGVELLTAGGVITLLDEGDSTVVGQGNTRQNGSGAILAMQASLSNARPLAVWNMGEGGSQSTTYLQLFKNLIASGIRPKIACFCAFSPNDTDKYTVAGTQRQIAGMSQFVGICRQYGIKPALKTPCPVSGTTATEEGFRRQVVAATKLFAAQLSTLLIDRDSVLTDYSTTSGGWLSGMNTDTKHPSPAGYAAERALWLIALAGQ